jgi:anaerobic magnesium-protoporphyrin IX monomethyl ester cyclase
VKNLDLLLVNPGDRYETYQVLGEKFSAVEPPVWAGLIASFVRKRGHSVSILDSNALALSPEKTAQFVIEAKPRLCVVVVYGHQPSASTQNMPSAGKICKAIKDLQSDIPILLVGGHVAALPEKTLKEEACDFVCGGEGPYTVVELLEAIKNRETNFGKVRGLYFRENGGIVRTELSPLVKNLDEEMPGIAWDLLPMEKYRAHNWHCFADLNRHPYASLYTTLGCPYKCTFCCIQAPFKQGEKLLGMKESVNSYRFWSPDAIVEQIDLLVNQYGVRNIKIADEMFVLNPRHVLGICEKIIERGYDLNIWAYARVDTVKDNMLEKLKKAGFHWLAFGIEAASERVRDDVQKGFGQEEIFETIRKVQDSGINIIGNYIFGLPEDNHKTMKATLDMSLELNCEFANFYCAMAYPGSQLYQLALREKWPLPKNWSGYSQHSVDTLPLPTKYLSSAEVLRFRDEAFYTYFKSEKYLSMVEKKFGKEAVQHIHEMTSKKLERELLKSAIL